MNKINGFLKRLWNDESGQGSTEYILVLALVVAIIVIFKDTIKKKVTILVESVMDKVKAGAESAATPN